MNFLSTILSPADLKKLNYKALHHLADEIREKLIAVASEKGGHLGASLGVVELTIALHYIFNAPYDKIIWDVGHQAYPHKMLTGRKDLIHTIRQRDGLSGFTKRAESEYDPFGAGHSSTSISAALGFAIAKKNAPDQHIIAVIGDGAISAGMAYEALNNAGELSSKIIVVLNDNKMSIAPAVGGMSAYLTKLLSSRGYYKAKNIAKNVLHLAPEVIERVVKNIKQRAKQMLNGPNFFEELGFNYIGPVDGHDLAQLIAVLKNVRENDGLSGPVLLHVITEKGKGFDSPEKSKESYHAVLPFDLKTKVQKKPEKQLLSYTKVFAQTLLKLAKEEQTVIAVTAAMPSGTGLDIMIKEIPDRVFDVGIAEQHAVTFAAGLAAAGLKPFVAIYSTFLQRAYDQIVHDVAIQSLPVRFMIDRAGLVGADGPTHAGSFDIAYLSNLPNFVCMAPSDEFELADMVLTAMSLDDRPSAVRYPKAETDSTLFNYEPKKLEIGEGKVVKVGKDIAIISLGTRLRECLNASNMLLIDGHDVTVADARFAKPIDENLLTQLAKSHAIMITVEEGVKGGFGAHVAHFLLANGLLDGKLKFRALCLPDYFIEQNTVEKMYEEAGLDAKSIYNIVKNLL